MAEIRLEVTSSVPDIAEPWADLVRRTAANVFMDPAALNAVFETGFARLHVLLAWDTGVAPQRLVGLWALQESSVTPLGPSFLLAPPYNYAFLSTPVVDPTCMHEVTAAFFGAIRTSRTLPKLVRIQRLDGSSGAAAAILESLAKLDMPCRILARTQRPFATREHGVKSSGSTRKKMRQDWNRLSAAGAVDIVNDPAGSEDAIEVFLALEAASWKGKEGTALLCNRSDAEFARRFLGKLAAERKASVAILRLDRRPIAAQVLLYDGRMAYTWKTAYDESYAKYSPGVLLLDKLTEQLFGSGVTAIESCSPEGGFVGRVWQGRRETLDLLADVGSRRSPAFLVASLAADGRAAARNIRDRLRAMAPRRRGPTTAA